MFPSVAPELKSATTNRLQKPKPPTQPTRQSSLRKSAGNLLSRLQGKEANKLTKADVYEALGDSHDLTLPLLKAILEKLGPNGEAVAPASVDTDNKENGNEDSVVVTGSSREPASHVNGTSDALLELTTTLESMEKRKAAARAEIWASLATTGHTSPCEHTESDESASCSSGTENIVVGPSDTSDSSAASTTSDTQAYLSHETMLSTISKLQSLLHESEQREEQQTVRLHQLDDTIEAVRGEHRGLLASVDNIENNYSAAKRERDDLIHALQMKLERMEEEKKRLIKVSLTPCEDCALSEERRKEAECAVRDRLDVMSEQERLIEVLRTEIDELRCEVAEWKGRAEAPSGGSATASANATPGRSGSVVSRSKSVKGKGMSTVEKRRWVPPGHRDVL
ncbi:MAG: hypothetical protein M1831_001535 [Alyxoria varia]|nr:MAG: hypothetical protein M1831_001535 [Alyxoria varia]